MIKKLKKIDIASYTFKIKWDTNHGGGSFDFGDLEIVIGTLYGEDVTLDVLAHELSEVCHCLMHTRYSRTDVDSDYLFNLDHRQFTAHNSMFVGALKKFIKN